MKKLFLKSLTLIMMLMLSVSTWAVDWSGISWAGNGSGNAAYTDAYKLSVPDGCGFVNIQNSFGTEAGFYVTVPAADITVTGLTATQYATQGAGMLLYVSAFTAQETEVTVTCNGGQNYVFVVYFKDGTSGGGGGSPEPEPAPEPAPEPVAPKYCNFATGHLADANFGDPAGRILLTIMKKSESSVGVTVLTNGSAVVDYYQVIINGVAKEVGDLNGVTVADEIVFTELASLNFTMNVLWHTPALGAGRWTTNEFSVLSSEFCVPEPESEYCNFVGPHTTQDGKSCSITWVTNDAGDVVITLGDGPSDGTGYTDVSFRGDCFEGEFNLFKVVSEANGEENAEVYFTRERSAAENYYILRKNATPLPAGTITIKTNAILAWSSAENATRWQSTGQVFTYTYGTKCPEEPVDNEAPVMTSASLSSTGFTSAILNVAATDNVAVKRYIVKNSGDEVGKYAAVDGKITVKNLVVNTHYTLSVYAMDAAENVSANKVDVELTTQNYPDAPDVPVTTGIDYLAIYAPSPMESALEHGFNRNIWCGTPFVEVESKYLFYNTSTINWIAWGNNNAGGDAIVGKEDVRGDKGGVNASEMEYLHLDVWSAQACPSFEVFINNTKLGGVNIAGTGWQAVNIPLSQFPEVAVDNWGIDNVNWIKFDGIRGVEYCGIANVYFWKDGGTAAVTGVSLDQTAATLEVGDNLTLTATVEPIDAANKAVTWTSSNTTVATVADGVVTAVAEGNATITATTVDGSFEATCAITVTPATVKTYYDVVENSDVTFDYALTYNLDGTLTMEVVIMTDHVGLATPSFSADEEWKDLANVDGVWTRTTTKTFTKGQKINCFFYQPYSGGAARFDFQYTVGSHNEPIVVNVETVTLNKTTANLLPTETTQLSASVTPANATDKNISWASSNTAVATVSETGLVTAVAVGTANITATSANGLEATCVVTVSTELVASTTTSEGTNAGVSIKYFITRNPDRTLTYNIYAQTSHDGLAVRVNDGDYHDATLVNGAYTWTSETKYTDGAVVNGFIYMPYAGNAARVDFSYTVGSGSTAPLAQLDETVDEISALNALDDETINLVVNRTISGNGLWNTLCLPFSMTAEQITATFGAGTQILTLADAYMKSAEDLYVAYKTVTTIEAGHPYLIKTTDAIPALFFEGITVDANAETTAAVGGLVQMIGTFCKTTIPDGPDYLYLSASDGYLYNYGEELAIKAFRCYYQLIGEAGTQVRAGGRVRARVVMGEQVATSLDNTSVEQAPRKLLINGELFILSAGHMYNAEGQLVK